MPYRRLPNTDQARVRALKAAVEKGDLYSVRDLAISLKSQSQASGECENGTAVYFSLYSGAQSCSAP